jgi:hypothetical protein
MTRYLYLNTMLFFSFLIAFYLGYVNLFIANDPYYLSTFILGSLMVAIVSLKIPAWIALYETIHENLILMGLIGTFFGLFIMFVDPQFILKIKEGDPIILLLKGVGTALGTTLVGAFGTLYLNVLRRFN